MLNKIRDLIANNEPELTDMSTEGDPACGTPGCIIGWARPFVESNNEFLTFPEIYERLGLTMSQGENLSLGSVEIDTLECLQITRDEVLVAIDSLIEDPTREMPAWPDRVLRALEC